MHGGRDALTGKIALVAGATTGIGEVTALAIPTSGATVVLAGRTVAPPAVATTQGCAA